MLWQALKPLRCDRECKVRYHYVVKMICASCTEREGFCGQLPKWYTVSYTYDTVHIHEIRQATSSCVALTRRCWERCEEHAASLNTHTHIAHYMVFSMPRSDIVPRGVLWRNLTESPGELQLEPWMPGISTLKDIFLSWRVCLRSASLWPIKRLHVRRPRQPHTPVLFLMIPWLP